jgi:sporulation integral membrane protein YlbJ
MKKGLKLCAYTVIPSLFPFMVISELIVSCGAVQRLLRFPAKLLYRLFKIEEQESCAFLLGAICGFPIGARTLCTMYDNGTLTKYKFERALTFCNNPGSAFVISAVGVSLFGSKRLGTVLYICLLLSAVTVGALSGLLIKSDDRQKLASAIPPKNNLALGNTGIRIFTSAIQNSAFAMLAVCAYVTFFSSFTGCIGALAKHFDASENILAALFGFFEISSGVSMSAEIKAPIASILICAAILGWSGLSVHLQIITICSGRGISFKPYFIAKAAQGLLCAFYVGIFIRFFPTSDILFAEMRQVGAIKNAVINSAFVCCVFFVATVLPLMLYSLNLMHTKKFRKK